MTIAGLLVDALVAAGLLLALFYGFVVTRHLREARRLGPPAGRTGVSGDAAAEVPAMRSRGQVFESEWQGARGYDRPIPPVAAGQSMVDRLVITVWTPLRPSRFKDPSYWTRYLPRVLLTWVVLFLLLPLLVGAFVLPTLPTTGQLGTFQPSAAQRAVPGVAGSPVSPLATCKGSTLSTSTSTKIVDIGVSNDGTVIGVRPGDRLVVSYLYAEPRFAPGTPLCVLQAPGAGFPGAYLVVGAGSGTIYLPQPTGAVVVGIEVTSLFGRLALVLLGISGVVLIYDVVVTVRLRREIRSR